jgi:hypothetical protein
MRLFASLKNWGSQFLKKVLFANPIWIPVVDVSMLLHEVIFKFLGQKRVILASFCRVGVAFVRDARVSERQDCHYEASDGGYGFYRLFRR